MKIKCQLYPLKQDMHGLKQKKNYNTDTIEDTENRLLQNNIEIVVEHIWMGKG